MRNNWRKATALFRNENNNKMGKYKLKKDDHQTKADAIACEG